MNREKPKDILSIDEIVDCVGKLDASGLQLDTILG